MAEPLKLTRVASLKTVEDFRRHLTSLGVDIPCDEAIAPPGTSPLAKPVEFPTINGKRIGNRLAIHPMEGWDGTTTGGVTDDMLRRWRRFGESGAKLICGGEAMAVRADGRANPNQIILNEENKAGVADLLEALKSAHREKHGTTDDLVVGFQLTHSGRFCRPNEKTRFEPRVAYRHPILDAKFKVIGDDQVFTDAEVEDLVRCYVRSAEIAAEIGADFVDIKHCHGYLLHEFLGAFTRPGKYGGSFENRTRILREIVAGIRAGGNRIDIGVRLSAFDFVPHRPDPALSAPGKPGPGIPEAHAHLLPYRYGFGMDQNDPTRADLVEPARFVALCAELGVKIVNISGGSPYYTPHLLRPAAYPPSDGYQPAYDPLIDVARHVQTVRALKKSATVGMVLVSSGLSYLQEYLPQVAQALVREGWTDIIGFGRAGLSYPEMMIDALQTGVLQNRLICRTFSDCTTAPRNGLPSGCYPLDKHYAAKPEAARLKEIKKKSVG